MPGCGLHLVLADRVLASGAVPGGAGVRAAFRAGAVAPDMGYFPGGHRFVSDLAHYVRSGALVRALVRCAGDDTARAFALGWATHVLADVSIHPLINRAAGALVHGDPDRPLHFADNPVAHVRVEQGLDATVIGRFSPPTVPALPNDGMRSVGAMLAAAYRETYGPVTSRRKLVGSYRVAARLAPLLLAYLRASAYWFGEPGVPPPALVMRVASAAFRATRRLLRGRPLQGLTDPVPAPGWLMDAIDGVVESFPARFADLRAGLADLADHNLDTGAVSTPAPTYPPAAATVRELGRRGGRV
jgi:hypothetical protein